MRSAGKFASKSTSNKRRVETSSHTEQKGKITVVQVEKRSIKNTPFSVKKRKLRTSTRKKTVSQVMNQSTSPIVIDESPQASPKDHRILVLADAATHTVVRKEKIEEEILLVTFVHKLRKRKTTPSAGEVQEKGHEDDEA